jgi:hypothetical protein
MGRSNYAAQGRVQLGPLLHLFVVYLMILSQLLRINSIN